MTEHHFSHIEHQLPRMVDVSEKPSTVREAMAESRLLVPSFVADLFLDGDYATKKGPVFATAILAGTMAVKQTSNLIPLCHPLVISSVQIDIVVEKPSNIVITCTVKSYGQTGVEMEALTGASIAALTIYDMCKSLTFEMTIATTKLVMKTGGTHERILHNK